MKTPQQIKERRAYRDGIKRKGDKIVCSELIHGVLSEELGVQGVITPPLYRRTVWVNQMKSLSCVQLFILLLFQFVLQKAGVHK